MENSNLPKIRFQPKQSELWYWFAESDVEEIGGGGARGGSKSGFGRRAMLLRRFDYENTTGLILRRTYPELYKSHIVKMFEEWPDSRNLYNEQRKELYLPWNNSRLFFGSAEHPKDIGAFYSAEFADIMIDEAQEFSEDEIDRLRKSKRCTSNKRIRPKMLLTFMPGMSEAGLAPVGLPYLKRVFIDGDLNEAERNKKWKFVQMYAWDNIEWFRKELALDGFLCDSHIGNDGDERCEDCMRVQEAEFYSWLPNVRMDYFISRTEYGRELISTSDQALREAWLFGKWNTFEGQYFKHWSEARHVISAEEARERIKPWHKRWRSGDWGYDHPFAFYWHAMDELGRVITYREMYGRQKNESALGKEIKDNSRGERYRGFPISWDAGKLSSRANPKFPKSIQQLISDGMGDDSDKPHPADSSPGSRIAGARLMSNLLDADMWQISDACPQLIKCIPSLIRDPDNPEDVLKVDWSVNKIGDDPYDGARMGLQFMLGSAVMPVNIAAEKRVAEYAKAHEQEVEDMDINTIAQLHRRATIQEQQRRGKRRGGLGKVWRPQN